MRHTQEQHKSGSGGAQLTSSYLADLRRRLPAGIVDEIAGGLAEAREHHLARGLTDLNATHAALAEFGDAWQLAAQFTRHAPGRRAARMGSPATAGEGTQNYLCAAQAAAILAGLAITAAWPGGWRIDPVIGLGIAAVSVREGIESWRGDDCC